MILGGDLNLYTQSEPAFQELIDPTNNITFVDPANRIGSWSNNLVYLDVFTQSTRTQTGLGGAIGGFDDRFDFIMTSENMLSNPDLFYVSDSYQVYGNNGNTNCYNQAINSSNCSGALFNATIRDALHDMSDHLPVTAEFQTNEALLSTETVVLNYGAKLIPANIVDEKVRLEIFMLGNSVDEIVIYNVYGQQMHRESLRGRGSIEFDVSGWSSGIYYIGFSNQSIKPLKFIRR